MGEAAVRGAGAQGGSPADRVGQRHPSKGQLDLEERGGRTFEGVAVRVAQRVLAMTAGIWHNKTGAPVTRSLVACDHLIAATSGPLNGRACPRAGC